MQERTGAIAHFETDADAMTAGHTKKLTPKEVAKLIQRGQQALMPALTAADCLLSTATEWGSSRWAVHNRCGRENELRYTRGIYRLPLVNAVPSAKPTPFHVGSLVHAGLRLVEAGVMAPAEATAAVIDAALATGQRFSQFDTYEAQRLLDAYWAHWGKENAGWPEGLLVVETERQLQATGLRHTGAIDTLLQQESDGELVIVDTKTRAQKLPEDAASLFATNPQFLSLSYMLQEELDLPAPPPIMVNAIMKTKVPAFDRVLVRLRQEQVDTWARNQAEIETRDEPPTSIMNYNACAPSFGFKCDYLGYCHGSEEERELHYSAGGRGLAVMAEEAT